MLRSFYQQRRAAFRSTKLRREAAERSDQESIDSVQVDPIDNDPAYTLIFEEAEELAKDELRDLLCGLGFCRAFGDVKKQILKERYFIDWSTPQDLNPNTYFG